MRVELLPSNIATLPHPNIPNAGEGQGDSGTGIFLDVLAQIAAAAGSSEKTFPENAPSAVQGRLDEDNGATSTAAGLVSPVLPRGNGPAVPKARTGSRMRDQEAPGQIAAVLTTHVADEAASGGIPMAAGDLACGESGIAGTPLMSWLSVTAPLSPLSSDTAMSREPGVFSATVAPELQAADDTLDLAGETERQVSGGKPENTARAAVPGLAATLKPAAPASAFHAPIAGPLWLNPADLRSPWAPELAGTSHRAAPPTEAALPAQPLLPGNTVLTLQNVSADAGSAQPPMTSLNIVGAAGALPASAESEVLPLSNFPGNSAAGSCFGVCRSNVPAASCNVRTSSVAVEGIQTSRPPVAAPESHSAGNLQLAAPGRLAMSTWQMASAEGSQINSAEAALAEGTGAGIQQAENSAAFRPAAGPAEIGAANRQIALHENTVSEPIGNAPMNEAQMQEPQGFATERLQTGYPWEQASDQTQGSSIGATALERPPTILPQAAIQKGEAYADSAPRVAALPFLRLFHLSFESIPGSAPISRELKPAPPAVFPAHLMVVASENQDRHQPQTNTTRLQAPSDPIMSAAVEPVNLAYGDTPENVLPAAHEPRPLNARLILDLPANGANVIPDLAMTQILLPDDGRWKPPTQSAMPASCLSEDAGLAAGRAESLTQSSVPASSFSEDPGQAAGRAESPTRSAVPASSYSEDPGQPAGRAESPTQSSAPAMSFSEDPGQAASRAESPTQSAVPATSFSGDSGQAAGRAESMMSLLDLNFQTGEAELTDGHSDERPASQPEFKPQHHRQQGQESTQMDVLRRESLHADSGRRVRPAAAAGAGSPHNSSGEISPLEVLSRLLAGIQRTAVEAGREEQAVRSPLPAEDAESHPTEVLELLRELTPDALGRTNTFSLASHAAPRPVQHTMTMTATAGAGGLQPCAHNAAATDVKALAALLAPKSPVPSAEPDFLSQLAAHIQMRLRDGESTMRIQLRPATFGRMEIKAETTASGIAATILTGSPSVKGLLENNLHILQQSFQDQGLRIDRIQVAVQEDLSPHHPSSGNQESRSGTGQQEDAGHTPWRRDRFEPAVEELALDAHTLTLMSPHHTFHTVA